MVVTGNSTREGGASLELGVLSVLNEWITLQGRGTKVGDKNKMGVMGRRLSVPRVHSALVWLVQTSHFTLSLGTPPPLPKTVQPTAAHLRLPLLPSGLSTFHCVALSTFDIPGPSLLAVICQCHDSAVSKRKSQT